MGCRPSERRAAAWSGTLELEIGDVISVSILETATGMASISLQRSRYRINRSTSLAPRRLSLDSPYGCARQCVGL
jgi:hypothetical protein